jgi:hypothetical protein
VYGGTEGRDAMYVKLVTDDGFDFIMKSEHAFLSQKIKDMALGPGPFEISNLEVILHYP